jgi:2-polyprenyl-3-methyl-5-hydroxy-6-metoxy-1,4-benzoquinol methylase
MKKFCTICLSESRAVDLELGVDLYRCPNCDHCFTDVSTLGSTEQYGEDYYTVKHVNWFENPNFELFERISGALDSLKQEAKLLDVGCGKGDLLRYLHPRHPNVELSGIDFTSNKAIPGINFSCGDVFDLDEEKRFDVIVSLAVIEHVEDVNKFVRKLHKLVCKGGNLIIMTVDDRSFLYSLARLLVKVGYKTPAVRLYEKHHLNHFNQKSLRYLMESNGFVVIEVFDHTVPIAAVDFESSSPFLAAVLRTVVASIFVFSRFIHKSQLQTMICKKS